MLWLRISRARNSTSISKHYINCADYKKNTIQTRPPFSMCEVTQSRELIQIRDIKSISRKLVDSSRF